MLHVKRKFDTMTRHNEGAECFYLPHRTPPNCRLGRTIMMKECVGKIVCGKMRVGLIDLLSVADCCLLCSIAGFKCPVCSKFILPDDIECHIVMCLTKPRLSYNGKFKDVALTFRLMLISLFYHPLTQRTFSTIKRANV